MTNKMSEKLFSLILLSLIQRANNTHHNSIDQTCNKSEKTEKYRTQVLNASKVTLPTWTTIPTFLLAIYISQKYKYNKARLNQLKGPSILVSRFSGMSVT